MGVAAAPRVGSALRSGTVYAVAAALQRGLTFFLLPVYTRVLGPSDYGRLSVLLAIGAAAVIVFSFGIDLAFFRTYFALREDEDRQRQFVTTAWIFLLFVPAVSAVVLALLAAPVLLQIEVFTAAEFGLAVVGSALLVSATVVPLAALRAEERLRDYLVLTGVTAGTTVTLTLLVVVGFDGGVIGWLLAAILANALTLIAALRLIPFRLTPGFDRRLLGGALLLGLPLVPHMLSHWGLGISNRVVLAGIVSTSDVGVYALAANIGAPVAILLAGLATGFFPLYARAATEIGARARLPTVVIVQFLLVCSVTSAAALLGPIAVRYLAPPEYFRAAELVPWIALAYGLFGLYFVPMNAVSLIAGRTGKVWIVTAGAAVVNLASLFVLVPSLGLVGAAVGLAAGYLVLLVGVWVYSRGPDNPVRYQWGLLARGTAVFAVIYALAVATSGDRDLVDAVVRLAWLLAVSPLLLLTRVVDPQDAIRTIRGLRRRDPSPHGS